MEVVEVTVAEPVTHSDKLFSLLRLCCCHSPGGEGLSLSFPCHHQRLLAAFCCSPPPPPSLALSRKKSLITLNVMVVMVVIILLPLIQALRFFVDESPVFVCF